MEFRPTALSDFAAHGFDEVIDVRAPAEWADDHLPGAINLPVLDDAERARVGTIYKQQSPFRARKVGAALVARNVARYLEDALADREGGWRPLVYCWRGGQRSGSFAAILSQIGWRVTVLAGGYKTWRRLVLAQLLDAAPQSPVILLDGNTGSRKTAVLAHLAAAGHQVIDLEGLARHRGSLFGALPGGQPTQKAFEGRLALALARLDPARPVVIEAESSRIGNCRLPPPLWKTMLAAPRIALTAPPDLRAAVLLHAYGDLVADPLRLDGIIASLRPLHPADRIAGWQAQAAAGEFVALAADLMRHHYDPRYARARQRGGPAALELAVTDLSDAALDGLAAQIATALPRIAGGRA